jgi:hypothetical protein
MIWYPLLVGGADANQNGFGDLMPAKFVNKFAMRNLVSDEL